jgi:hypothetical protein
LLKRLDVRSIGRIVKAIAEARGLDPKRKGIRSVAFCTNTRREAVTRCLLPYLPGGDPRFARVQT